ncbi:MAG: beta-ribofuranosylaminobenzene 5'-phosphate synthase family protein [Isosphaeraceae bacterium]
MTGLRINTPSRLHFGLLALGPDAPRQFGGVGLMIDQPGINLTAQVADRWHAEGPLAERTLRIAERVALGLKQMGLEVPAIRFQIDHAPPEHVGLGVGTQLGLALAKTMCSLAGLADPPVVTLAGLTGRGLRSGIGLHGFIHGGLIVDGGRRGPQGVPPLLTRLEFPADWHALIVVPANDPSLHGPDEVRAFASLSAVPDALTDRLCRLVLLGLLPAVLEHDIASFGAALSELQDHVGLCFSTAQGGLYARSESEAVVSFLRDAGLHGVGQSSWGPTLYGFTEADDRSRFDLARQVRSRFDLAEDQVLWACANRQGSRVDPW